MGEPGALILPPGACGHPDTHHSVGSQPVACTTRTVPTSQTHTTREGIALPLGPERRVQVTGS
jgi:hypothetical protein